MRAVICAVTATIMLGLGMAFLLQATQASSESLEATLEETRSPFELRRVSRQSRNVAHLPDPGCEISRGEA
jgi:Tfp pilus assembly protein PilO